MFRLDRSAPKQSNAIETDFMSAVVDNQGAQAMKILIDGDLPGDGDFAQYVKQQIDAQKGGSSPGIDRIGHQERSVLHYPRSHL